VDVDLVGSYNNTILKQRLKMIKKNFSYIRQQVVPIIFKKNTNMEKVILLKTRVAIALIKIAFGSFKMMFFSYHINLSYW